nr:nucleoside 2-deoxyribosyltransferase [Bacillus subtilis]
MTPQQCTKIDFDEISTCDLFVAFPGSPASPGTHIEIGWASALKKKIVLLLEKDRDYAFLIQGLNVVADVEYINFKDTDDLLQKIKSILMK